MIMLTIKESIHAAILFLKIYYDQTSSKDVLAVINGLSNALNTNSAEETVWKKHLESANAKLSKNSQFLLANTEVHKIISEEQAFEAMILLLENIYKKTNSFDIGGFLGDLLHPRYGETSDPAAWYDWQKCLQKVVSERQAGEKQ